VLPGATIVATHPATGATIERLSDAEGRFYLPALRVGTWNLTVTLAGFAPQQRVGLQLELGRSLSLDFTLGVALSEQVLVATTAPQLQTTNAEISDVIENREVVQLPLNGRNLMALAQLSSAVVIHPAARAAKHSSRPGRSRTSAVSDRATTSICSTGSRSPTSCSTTW
jgi:hypothetical protein